LRKKKL
jgi:hypothetical protein